MLAQLLYISYHALYHTDNTKSNSKVEVITKEAIEFLDSRNNFWSQQVPHHVRERSMNPSIQTAVVTNNPLSTASLLAYSVNEMKRINSSKSEVILQLSICKILTYLC